MAGYLPALGEALRDYANHKKEIAAGRVKSLDETLAQRDMFDERAQIVEILMREMDTRGAKSAAALKALLDRYARLAQNVADPNTASLFGEEVPDTRPMEILENARRELAEEEGTGGQRSLPGADAGNRVRQAARAKPDAPDAGQGRGPDAQGEVGGRFSTKEPPKRLYGAELERALDAANTTQDGVYDPLTAAQRDLVRKQHEDAWRERDAYLAALREVADATGLEYDPSMEPYAVKDIPGIAKKVRKDGELGATDALRYTLVMPPDSAPEARKHGARTVRELRNRGYAVLRDKDGKADVDNSFASEKGKYGSGYRDFAIKVTKNGEVMELQLLQRNMLDKKFGIGHDLYRDVQLLKKAIARLGGVNAQGYRRELLAINRRMRKIYTAAFWADNPLLASESRSAESDAQAEPNSAISSLESNAPERNAASSEGNTAASSPNATASSKDSPDRLSESSSSAGSTFMSRTSNPSVPQGDGGVNTKDSGPRYSTAAQAVEIYGTPERALRAHMNQLSVVRREGRIVDYGAMRILADLSRQVGDAELQKEARRFMFDTAREGRDRAAEFKGMAGRETADLFASEQGGLFSTRTPIKRGESPEYDRTAAEYDTASREAGRIRQLLWNFRERRYAVTERRSAEERKRRGIKPGQYAPDVNPELTKRLNAREEALRKRLKEAKDKADTAFTAWREAGEAAGVRFSVAPNGKPSNLNAHQWAQVRTQAFKRWGGDWEAWGHRQFLEGEPVARLTGEEFPNDGNPLLRRVIDFLSGKPTVRNSALGDVIVDARSIKDSWRHGRNTAKAAAFAAVPDIIGNGRVVFRKNNWKNRNYERVLLAAPITIGAEDYVAVVAVNSKPDSNRFFFHEVVLTKRIRESALTTGSYPEESGRPRADDESIPSVLHHIFSVKPPSVLTDDNGEPRTFYHLTYADFATFNTPAFFAESPEGLSDYGNRTIRAFLSIGNMATDADIVSAAREARVPSRENAYEYLSKGLIDSIGDRNVDRVASILKTRGFDGAKVSDYDVPQSYVVFSPTQIKSATGNTGAFDPDNPDIRYSTAPPPGSNIPQTTWTRYRLAAFTAAMVHGQDRAAYRQAMLDQHGPAVEPYLDEFANDYDTAYAAAVQRAQQAARMQAPPERPRPDLGRIGTSQEAQTDLDRVDATRENPERGQADWERQADEWLAATPEPEAIAAIRAKAENGESLTPGETKAAHRLYDILHERWVQSGDPKDRQAALEFAAAYRDTGSTVSDEMNARKIPTTPAGVAHWLMEHLTAPGRALERRIGAARAVTRDKSATGAQKATARRVLAKLLEKQGQQVDQKAA